MQKDYAKYTTRTKGRVVEPGWRRRLFWVTLVVLVTFSAWYGYDLYKTHASGLKLSALKSYATHFNQEPAKPVVDDKDTPIEVQQDNEIHFNFYTELPNNKIKPEDAERPVLAAKEEKVKEHKIGDYFVELGTFKDPSSAGEMRVSLLLAGFEAELVKILDKEQGPQYRLQQGPFVSMGEAKAIQQKLKQKGIDSSVVKKTP